MGSSFTLNSSWTFRIVFDCERKHMDSFLTQVQQTSWIEWMGTATGLVAVILSIREKVMAWPLYIACYGLYAVLSYQASLSAAMVLNACFIPISIYGWWKWSTPQQKAQSGEEEVGTLSITRMNRKTLGFILILTVLLSLAWGVVNAKIFKGALPYLDAFATVISFVAQWMLSRKYVENWIAWIMADVAFTLLWGLQGYWVTVLMFAVFTGLAISGWWTWKKEDTLRA